MRIMISEIESSENLKLMMFIFIKYVIFNKNNLDNQLYIIYINIFFNNSLYRNINYNIIIRITNECVLLNDNSKYLM